jgi:polygalacturonase
MAIKNFRVGAGIVMTAAALLVSQQAFAAGRVCDARSYGAKADGATKDTKAIQAAIDDCASKGGGTVRLSGGTFVSGPIELKSHITLHVEKEATLLGSADAVDYPKRIIMRQPTLQGLVSATNAEYVTITGGGTIDGAGQPWWEMARRVHDRGILGNPNPRPMLLLLDHCKHVVVENITIQNSPFWQVVPYYSDDLVFRNLRILAPANSPNTDALDPFSSSNIKIDHLYADVGDDNIAIKSGAINSPGPDAPSHDILITDCEFRNGHGLSIGSELSGGAYNIRAERINFIGTKHGIRIKSNRDRGNKVENVSYKDITMKDVGNAFVITEYYPKLVPEGAVPSAPMGRLTPRFHNITVENLVVTGANWAGAVVGLPESPVENVTFKKVHISAKRGMTLMYANVSGEDVQVRSDDGKPMTIADGAKANFKE